MTPEQDPIQTKPTLPFSDLADMEHDATVVFSRENLRVISLQSPTAREVFDLNETDTAAAAEAPLAARSVFAKLQLHGRDRVARYADRGLLGQGTTAMVHTVHDANCDRDIAVKIPKAETGDRENIDAFIAEAGIVARLEHPNIIPVYDLDVDDLGQLYLAMRRVEGQTLRDYIDEVEAAGGYDRRERFNDLVQIFLKVCDALAFAHTRDLVHQDVKPENITLGRFGEVFVIDWGASVAVHDKLVVTPAYMSPQQARAEPPTPADDVYCLGGTLYHALLLRLPTAAETIEGLIQKRQEGVVDPPTQDERRRVPAQLLDIALKAMAADPAERYQTIDDLAEDLRHYQEGLAVSAHQEGLFEFLARWYRHHRRTVWSAAVVLLVMAVAGMLWHGEVQKRRQEQQRREAAERRQQEIEAKLLADWREQADLDFSQGRPESFPFAPQFVAGPRRLEPCALKKVAAFRDGTLELRPRAERILLRFDRDVPEETRVEMVVRNTGGINLGINISGDVMTGHRLRIYGDDHIELETERGGTWKVLHHCNYSLDPDADEYRLVFRREGNVFIASVNGEEILRYPDPLAPRGPAHRTDRKSVV